MTQFPTSMVIIQEILKINYFQLFRHLELCLIYSYTKLQVRSFNNVIKKSVTVLQLFFVASFFSKNEVNAIFFHFFCCLEFPLWIFFAVDIFQSVASTY